ncbi:nitronate monooxygenase [bacterium]|nr:nitronate monooxygenase [bacterium]
MTRDAALPTRITELFGISYPIVQAGMIWVSGGSLAAAVSNAGGLGLVGAGSMRPDTFREQVRKAKALTDKPFGVNMPLFYKYSEDWVAIALEEGVKIFFMSGGSPAKYTPMLKERGCKVVQVVGTAKHAIKSEAAGCDAVVAEGFEAGGHNSPEETTTMVLVPQVADAVRIPVIAAGGIGDGRAMAAAFALGAEGVQVGTRFAATVESSGHSAFKQAIVGAQEGETKLLLKQLVPVRLLKNAFSQQVQAAEARGATKEELAELLGSGRARLAMHEGNLEEGEIEVGQVSALIRDIPPAAEIVQRMVAEYEAAKRRLP